MSRRNVTARVRRADRKKTLHKFSGLAVRNPVLVGGLLLAPVVVASISLKNAAALSLTLMIVTIPTMLVASALKTMLPQWLRVPFYTLVASLLLIPAAWLVTPIAPTIFDSMGMYFSLMVFNSVLFTRSEKFAIKKNLLETLLDGLCYCGGFAAVILAIAAVRELLASNSLWGIPIALPFKISAVVLPFAGFLLVGIFAAGARFLRELARKLMTHHRRSKLPVGAMVAVAEEVAT